MDQKQQMEVAGTEDRQRKQNEGQRPKAMAGARA